MTDGADDFFAPSAFDPEAALPQMQRSLRDLKLSARGHGFEMRGKRLAELTVESEAIFARMAKKPALTPQWDAQRIASATDQRKWLDELRRRLARWDQDE